LHRFVEENGRVPTAHDMTIKNGYLPHSAYQKNFGTHNNALKKAGLKFNQHRSELDGTETCAYCNKRVDEISNFTGWRYDENDIRYCSKHGAGYKGKNPDYVNGELDINSANGLGRLGEILVAKTLKIADEFDCNRISCGFKIDLYHNVYKKIDVKTVLLGTKRSRWKFDFKAKKEADTYICLGFDEERKHILHVWIVPNEGKIRDSIGISIENKYYSLLKRSHWEVDNKSYNDTLKTMKLDNCKIMVDKKKDDYIKNKGLKKEKIIFPIINENNEQFKLDKWM